MKEWSINAHPVSGFEAQDWANSLADKGWEIQSVTPVSFTFDGECLMDAVVVASRERKHCANGCGTILGDHRDEFCSACAREIESSTCSVTGCDQPAFENGLCARCALDATLYSEPGSEHEGFSETGAGIVAIPSVCFESSCSEPRLTGSQFCAEHERRFTDAETSAIPVPHSEGR